ncbi:uncharacterized protein LOC142532603 isoform X2 [Primulina tabacum]|uniref:uncharacterized protein LOC142532603 isoform X2 n=1 Tax=Primulina tabacum TaxID=48773 RepID=UPI003F5917CF
MVFVVRQDLKMGAGMIASQCAHAATGIYSELMERNKLRDAAESIRLPTFIVADAGRTQVSAGSNTVLAIGPGAFLIQSSIIIKCSFFMSSEIWLCVVSCRNQDMFNFSHGLAKGITTIHFPKSVPLEIVKIRFPELKHEHFLEPSM